MRNSTLCTCRSVTKAREPPCWHAGYPPGGGGGGGGAVPAGGTRRANLLTPPRACMRTLSVSSGWMVLCDAARATAPARMSLAGFVSTWPARWRAPSVSRTHTSVLGLRRAVHTATLTVCAAHQPRPQRHWRAGAAAGQPRAVARGAHLGLGRRRGEAARALGHDGLGQRDAGGRKVAASAAAGRLARRPRDLKFATRAPHLHGCRLCGCCSPHLST